MDAEELAARHRRVQHIRERMLHDLSTTNEKNNGPFFKILV